MNAEEIQARQQQQAMYMEARLAVAAQLMPTLIESYPERMGAPEAYGVDVDEDADIAEVRAEVELSIAVDAIGYAEMLLEQNASYTPYWAAPDVIQGDFGESGDTEVPEEQPEFDFDVEDDDEDEDFGDTE